MPIFKEEELKPVLFRDKANTWLTKAGLNKRFVVRKLFKDFNSSEESNFLCDKWRPRFEDQKIVADLGWNFDPKKLEEIFKARENITR